MPGESNPAAKLSDTEVHEIRVLLAAGFTQSMLAETYDVANAQIGRIATGDRRSNSTISDGLQDMIDAARETRKFGVASSRGKLTDDDVVAIRHALSEGERAVVLAAKFGVSTVQIYRIKTGSRRK
jgi:hypothetical protein